MNQIIKIAPINRVFSITWNTGIRCNYDCMYCPTESHDSVSPYRTLSQLQNNWISVFDQTQKTNLKYKISFTGGEVTGNKHFLPFIKWLRENYNQYLDKLIVTTNGSATYKYYKNLFECVDIISFSLHSEHVNEQKFFNTIIKLHQNIPATRHINVNIMDEWWNRDRFAMYVELLTTHGISYSINQIDHSYQTRTIPILKGKLNLD